MDQRCAGAAGEPFGAGGTGGAGSASPSAFGGLASRRATTSRLRAPSSQMTARRRGSSRRTDRSAIRPGAASTPSRRRLFQRRNSSPCRPSAMRRPSIRKISPEGPGRIGPRPVEGGAPLHSQDGLLQPGLEGSGQVGRQRREVELLHGEFQVRRRLERTQRTLRRDHPAAVDAGHGVDGGRGGRIGRKAPQVEPLHLDRGPDRGRRDGVLHLEPDPLHRELAETEAGRPRRARDGRRGRVRHRRVGRRRRVGGRGPEQRHQVDGAIGPARHPDPPALEGHPVDGGVLGEHVGVEAGHLVARKLDDRSAPVPAADDQVAKGQRAVHDLDHSLLGPPLEVVGGLEAEHALADLGRDRVLVVGRVLGKRQVLEGEGSPGADGLDEDVAAPGELLTRLGAPGEAVGALVLAMGPEVLELERDRADGGLERAAARAVGEVDLGLRDAQVAHREDHASAGLRRRRTPLVPGGEALQDVGHVELAPGVEAGVEVRAVELQVLDPHLPPENPPQAGIHVQAIEGGQPASVEVLDPEALHADREREGIHPDALHADRSPGQDAHLLHDLPLQDAGGDHEPQERVQRGHPRQRGEHCAAPLPESRHSPQGTLPRPLAAAISESTSAPAGRSPSASGRPGRAASPTRPSRPVGKPEIVWLCARQDLLHELRRRDREGRREERTPRRGQDVRVGRGGPSRVEGPVGEAVAGPEE